MPPAARRPRRIRTVWACALLLFACKQNAKSDDDVSGGGAETLTYAEFVMAYQERLCLNLQRCCSLSGMALDTSICGALYANAGTGTASTTFDPEAAAQCLTDMAASSQCHTTNAVPSCTRVYWGSRGPGESCTLDVDCAQPEAGSATCSSVRGFCVAGLPGQLNDSCQQSCERDANGNVSCDWGPASSELAGGAYVINCMANDGLTCGATGQCVALAGVGQNCVTDASCDRSLYCATATVGSAANCQPRGGIGSSCVEFSRPCIDAAYCSGGFCVGKKPEGERCLSNAECLGVCDCRPSGDCASVGVCADPADVAASFAAAIVSLSYCSVPPTP